jgi:hypothetical protein
MTDYMSTLLLTGVVVIPLPEEIVSGFDLARFLNGQKEYKVSNPDTIFVVGGFGALANPSSQHHEEIRKLRRSVYNYMRPLFAAKFPGKFLELIPDRFSIRNKNLPITAESWHKDVTAVVEEGEHIFGGYLNLDANQTQYFSCIPGSHLEPTPGEGFAKLSEANAKQYDSRRIIFNVPPRSTILFDERTTHEIAKRKIVEDKSYRQYFKWRISKAPKSTLGYDVIKKSIVEQGVFPLHSIGPSPLPPMYGKLHALHWSDRLVEFSQNVRDCYLDAPNKKGQILVKRFLPSLLEVGAPLFPDYTEEEISMLYPRAL